MMTGIEINERTEMFDMQGEVPDVYRPGHVYIIGEHAPEPGVLKYVVSRATGKMARYICLSGGQASLWEEEIRRQLGESSKVHVKSAMKPDGLLWSDAKAAGPACISDTACRTGAEITTVMPRGDFSVGQSLPPWKRQIAPGDGPDVSLILCGPEEMAEDIAAQYLGRFQPRCYVMYDDRDLAQAVKDKVEASIAAYRKRICETIEKLGTLEFFYVGQDFVVSLGEDDVMLGRLGREVTCNTMEEALDLPVFSDWTLLRLWCRIQGQVGHWLRNHEE